MVMEKWKDVLNISIHALLTESDGEEEGPVLLGEDFNPRSPHGERPCPCRSWGRRPGISIHALLTESDTGPG